jgi:DmsE family decaheme c-type cytochrome
MKFIMGSLLLAGGVMLLGSNVFGAESTAAPPSPEVCKSCHENYYNSYEASIHGKTGNPGSPATDEGCAACHGDGTAHVKAGGGKGVGGIVNPGSKSMPAAARSAVCLNCHVGNPQLSYWDAGKHNMNDVTCTNCHSIHDTPLSPPSISPFVTTARTLQYETCVTCHRDIRSQIFKSTHHPIIEGKVQCSDCHNPHGSPNQSMIVEDTVPDLCEKCHAEKRGPFIWEHPPVAENCLNCHNPHGTTAASLLNEKVPTLCQDCHDVSRHPSTVYDGNSGFTGNSPSRFFVGRSCLNCHSEIHGSNAAGNQGSVFVR